MFQRFVKIFLLIILVGPGLATGETPEPAEIVDRMIAAVGGEEFAAIGVLEFVVSEEETHNDGTSTVKNYKAFVDTKNVDNLRAELEGNVVIAKTNQDAWAVINGKQDERRQTPYMARGTLRQRLFPLLLPYSLKMEGVWIKEVGETTWDGRESWVLTIPFAKGFFTSAVLNTTWRMVVAKDDYSILSAEFVPSAEFRNVQKEGIRYRTLKYDTIEGARIPSQVLLIGIDVEGRESGHVRVTKLAPTVRGPFEPTLFIDPRRLAAMEEEE